MSICEKKTYLTRCIKKKLLIIVICPKDQERQKLFYKTENPYLTKKEKQLGLELGPSPRGRGKDGNSEGSEGGKKCYWNKMTWNSEDRN